MCYVFTIGSPPRLPMCFFSSQSGYPGFRTSDPWIFLVLIRYATSIKIVPFFAACTPPPHSGGSTGRHPGCPHPTFSHAGRHPGCPSPMFSHTGRHPGCPSPTFSHTGRHPGCPNPMFPHTGRQMDRRQIVCLIVHITHNLIYVYMYIEIHFIYSQIQSYK